MTAWNQLPARTRKKIALQIADANGWICHLCRKPIDPHADEWHKTLSVDHIVSQYHGGTNDLENLAPAHLGCNAGRSFRALKSDAVTVDNLAAFF